MLKPEMIPDKVWSAFTDAVYSAGYSKQALAAALNAWPDMEEHVAWPEGKLSHIILPMEVGDE